MIDNIYVGKKVYYVIEFTNDAYYHDHHIGCDVGKTYYTDKKYVFIEKIEDKFYYFGTDILCKIVNSLDIDNKVIGCYNCESKSNYPNCSLKLSKAKVFYGVMDVVPISDITLTSNVGDSINFLRNYNTCLDENLEKRLELRKKAKSRFDYE